MLHNHRTWQKFFSRGIVSSTSFSLIGSFSRVEFTSLYQIYSLSCLFWILFQVLENFKALNWPFKIMTGPLLYIVSWPESTNLKRFDARLTTNPKTLKNPSWALPPRDSILLGKLRLWWLLTSDKLYIIC